MAPKKADSLPPVNGHHQMSYMDLAEADDLASTITVDAFLGFTTHKMTQEKGARVNTLIGCIAELNLQEEREFLKDKQNDFSVMYSSRKNCSQLWLGPASYVNHDCKPNCKFTINCDGDARMSLEAKNPIKIGDEIYIHYGSHFFDTNNSLCECFTCELLEQGYFSNRVFTNASVKNKDFISEKNHSYKGNTLDSINESSKLVHLEPTAASLNGYLPKGVSTGLARRANSKGYSLRHTLSRLERVKAKLFADTISGEAFYSKKLLNDENVNINEDTCNSNDSLKQHDIESGQENMPKLKKIVIQIPELTTDCSSGVLPDLSTPNVQSETKDLSPALPKTPPPPTLEPAPFQDEQISSANVCNDFSVGKTTLNDSEESKISSEEVCFSYGPFKPSVPEIDPLIQPPPNPTKNRRIRLTYCDRLLLDEAKRLAPQSEKRIRKQRKRDSSAGSSSFGSDDSPFQPITPRKRIKTGKPKSSNHHASYSKISYMSSPSSPSTVSSVMTTDARLDYNINNVIEPPVILPVYYDIVSRPNLVGEPNLDKNRNGFTFPGLDLKPCNSYLHGYLQKYRKRSKSATVMNPSMEIYKIPSSKSLEFEDLSLYSSNLLKSNPPTLSKWKEESQTGYWPASDSNNLNTASTDNQGFPYLCRSECSSICSELTIPQTYDGWSLDNNSEKSCSTTKTQSEVGLTQKRFSPSPPILKPVTPQHFLNNCEERRLPSISKLRPQVPPKLEPLKVNGNIHVNSDCTSESIDPMALRRAQSSNSKTSSRRITVTLKRFGSHYYCVSSK